ncbi:MAG TPA: acetoacetate decarboxylase family protein, partial [Candidatus Binataceae bacterium]|nr:acetoacetate decarboxylase family protein [Candidatus Binataceae bacterium]
MAKQGRLNLKNAQYSMPADAAAYQSPPFYYRNTRAISVAFETDVEAALEALPAPLSLPDPATAVLSFYEYPWTTFGPYNEVILSLLVQHHGRPMSYIMHIAVTTEPPMLAGREIWGFPKKLAHIEFKSEKDMVYGTLERPAGVRLASAIVRPERPATNGHSSAPPAASLRLIPSAEEGGRPVCAEVIETHSEVKV